MKLLDGVVALCRILLALVFIFSGFVKGVDPWGTAIKLTEYFHALGLDPLAQWNFLFSICLSGGEMLLGFSLLFRLGRRFVPLLMLVVVGLLTLFTLFIAIWNPVADCGCFGDAVKLTNWQTFYKNLILLALALVVYLKNRPRRRTYWEDWGTSVPERRRSGVVEWGLCLLFTLFSFGVGTYCYYHLPLIDFLPFKVGVNLAEKRQSATSSPGEMLTTLIYKDRTTGKTQEFSLTDTTWYDSLRWEFVDTRIVERKPVVGDESVDPALSEFSIFDATGDHTDRWLGLRRAWFLITLSDPARLTPECRERLSGVADYAQQNDMEVVAVTSKPIQADSLLSLGAHTLRLYNMDGTMMKMVIRAHTGLLLFKEGTILAKWNCRDIPEVLRADSPENIVSWIVERPAQVRLHWLIGLSGGVLVLLYLVYFIGRRRR